ncbi:MAG: aminodeoxychorismate synthase component I [Planctomycetes bacterium]|nr:aminodeoxychorismate synthase component I [Planctomycetota bacterium]
MSAEFDIPLIERLDPALDAVDAFRHLSDLRHVVFFDSALRHPKLGRWSFLSADPVEWLEAPADGSDAMKNFGLRIADCGLNTAFLNPQSRVPSGCRNPQSTLPPFTGGWAGMFGYELARGLEKLPAAAIDEFQLPALAVGLYDVVVAFDHQQKSAWLVSQGIPERDPTARHERAAARMATFRERLSGRSATSNNRATTSRVLTADSLAPQFAVKAANGLTSNFSADAYRQAIRRAIDYIRAGDIFQVNLSQRLLHPAIASAAELYCRLRERNPAPFAGYLDGGDWQIASASPERFIRVEHGRVETRPIKGTRGRTRRPEADLFSADELRASEKDRAENVMIVDLLRNDLSRTCRPDSIHVSQLCGLETYEYVQHLVSVVEGTLRDDCSPLDLLRTSFPGGSVTGAPKIRAMEIIAELEPTVRGAYCGSLGYIGLDGRMDTSILIRTVTAARGWWQLPVGGAIVAQSNPREEYEETWHKAAGLLRALAP